MACILIVEADVLVRNPLAEYLRECGYQVLEAVDNAEARQLLGEVANHIDIVLADAESHGEGGFVLATWVRSHQPGVDVVLAGTIAKAAQKAGDLCEEGPALTKPYDHQLVHDRIRRLLAARDRRDRDR